MSDELKRTAADLAADLVKDVKGRLPELKKIREISKLSKDIGEDTEDIDNMLDAAESFADMILKRFDKTVPKE